MNYRTTLEGHADFIAMGAHAGQSRKYTPEPYIVHPRAVAEIVRSVPGHTPEMVAAALLHDVVEDTVIEDKHIRAWFGEEVGNLVYWLTDVSKLSDGPRAYRKQLDKLHIAKAPAAAKTVKLADMIDNMRTIVGRASDKFSKIYITEMDAKLGVLMEGDARLWEIANTMVKEARNKLGI